MKQKTYSKYKPSGVEWLGDVPAYWEVKKLKWIYQSIMSGDSILPDDIAPTGSYPVYGGNGIMGYTGNFNSSQEDIIIGRVGAKCGNVHLVSGQKWISDNALKLVIHQVNQKYLLFALKTKNLNQLANQNAQPLITGSMVGNQFIPLPPLVEQQAIAAFLDRETSRLDALVEKQKRLIALVQEKRTALISQAVTKGLNPSAKLRPSGVEWLGNVPAHWQVKKLKYVLRLQTKKTETDQKKIALENIESWTGKYLETASEFEGDGIAFVAGDILFGKLRPYLAKVYLATEPGECVGDIFVLHPSITIATNYAANFLRTKNFIQMIDGSTYGSKMPRVSWEFMGNQFIPLPPLVEQQAIAAFLDRETAKLDALVSKAQAMMAALQEYRTALISAAVTGKIDVRE